MLSIVSVLFAWALSLLLGYDGYLQKLNDTYAAYGEQYGIDLRMPLAEYEALDEAGRKTMEEAYAAMSANSDAVRNYNKDDPCFTILITSIALLLGYLVMEFFVPLKSGNGVTLGKKVFGLGLMRTDGVRVNTVSLFIRAVLGKYAIETMIPCSSS